MSTEVARIVVPKATPIMLPPGPKIVAPKGTQLRIIPEAIQLRLSRSLTFGVLGEDSKLYPSSRWETENRRNFGGTPNLAEQPKKSEFLVTSLDTRKHNPQSKQIFHIRRIHKEPVCSVTTSVKEESTDVPISASVYTTSYPERERQERIIARRYRTDKSVDGIIPGPTEAKDNCDSRTEMMLPVCDSTVLTSSRNPHRYLLRKRKVPPPFRQKGSQITSLGACGIVYPNLEIPRMSEYIPGNPQTGPLPFYNEPPPDDVDKCSERVSVSSLSGMSFSRKRFIEPPTNLIKPGFNGGVQVVESHKFDDKYLPFIRAKTII